MTLDDIIAQPTVTLDNLRAKLSVLAQVLDQEQKLLMQSYKSNTLPPRHNVKDKNVEIDNRNKDTKKKSPPVQCDKCQGYGQIIDKCTISLGLSLLTESHCNP